LTTASYLSFMHTPADISVSTATRQRLLEAAGQVFAEQGFRNTTIREICRRAQANLAAVNYHFGDKERLYLAVIEYAHARAGEKYQLTNIEREDLPAAERLRAFIHAFLFSLFGDDVPAWLGKLMAREMVEPTAALDALVEKTFRPNARKLESIVRELLGARATDEQVRLCQLSIVGQCLHHRNARPVIERLFPEQRYGPEDIKALADHIARFSLGALGGLARAEY